MATTILNLFQSKPLKIPTDELKSKLEAGNYYRNKYTKTLALIVGFTDKNNRILIQDQGSMRLIWTTLDKFKAIYRPYEEPFMVRKDLLIVQVEDE